MTTEPTRTIPLHIGGRQIDIVWYRLEAQPRHAVTRWRLAEIWLRLTRAHRA
jgi:hypothetical protein